MTPTYVVTVTATITDGTVVRWYLSPTDAEAMRPTVSVSRNAVIVHDETVRSEAEGEDLHRLVDYAVVVRWRLRCGEDVRDLATHERRGLAGTLVEIERTTP